MQNKIWKTEVTIEKLNERNSNTMSDFLGIEIIEIGDDFLKAKMPVTERTKQPLGIMHGGASCVLAETVGSVAANCCVDPDQFYCVGLDLNTNHIRSVSKNNVYAHCKPFHIGRSTQVWSIEIFDEDKKLVSVSRLTMAVLAKK